MADNEEWFYHEKTVGGVTGDPVIGNDVADG
jgi:hypothetical protein